MTITGFSKVVPPSESIAYRDLKDVMKSMAVDAAGEIFRCGVVDPSRFEEIMANTLNQFIGYGVKMYWIFDSGNNALKAATGAARRAKRDAAATKVANTVVPEEKGISLDSIKWSNNLPDCVDTESPEVEFEDGYSPINLDGLEAQLLRLHVAELDIKTAKSLVAGVAYEHAIKKQTTYKKQAWCPSRENVECCKRLLTERGIPWQDSPNGVEAEKYCCRLVIAGCVEGVWSNDFDCMPYGGNIMVRRSPTNAKAYNSSYPLQIYRQSDVRKIILDGSGYSKVTMYHVAKLAVILGTDFAAKTPRVGPKTVLKKMKGVKLTEEQKIAVHEFVDVDEWVAFCVPKLGVIPPRAEDEEDPDAYHPSDSDDSDWDADPGFLPSA